MNITQLFVACECLLFERDRLTLSNVNNNIDNFSQCEITAILLHSRCHALHYDELFGIPVDFPRIFGSTQFQAIVLDWPLEITPLVSVEVFKLYVHSKLSRKKQHDLFLVVFVQFGMYIYEMHFYDCFLICSKFS